MIKNSKILFLILAAALVSCSKVEDKIHDLFSSSKKGLIITPSGGLYKSEEDWKNADRTRFGEKRYLQLHERAIRSAEDWKNYILAIFPEAKESPPGSIKPYPWALNERSFVLYHDFLNTGKPTAVFIETMPNLPKIRTLVVSEWDKDQWNKLLRMDENGRKTPYVSFDYARSGEYKGFGIRLFDHFRPDDKKYFGFQESDNVSWHTDVQRYCFSDTAGPGDTLESMEEFEKSIICNQKDLKRAFPEKPESSDK
ncbi:MAG: hypothetical protein HYT79_02270 [Elusimicrobia bacterium]|nr:hypothetical protein [Elusimicrobiota bacterium]